VQAAVIVGAAVLCTWTAAKAIAHVRRRRPGVLVATCAFSALVLLLVERVVSLHWLDSVLRHRLPGNVTVAGLAEIVLLALIVGNGAVEARRQHARPGAGGGSPVIGEHRARRAQEPAAHPP
jgi:hypothetical protein